MNEGKVLPLRSTSVYYTEEELGHSWSTEGVCKRFPQVVANRLMDDRWSNYCIPESFYIRRPPLTVQKVKQFDVGKCEV